LYLIDGNPTYYNNHKKIPLKFRRVILDEMLVTRVSKVPIEVCNEIIEQYVYEDENDESLRDFEVEWIKEGKANSMNFNSYQDALVQVDKVLEYGENRDSEIMIVIRQAKVLLRGYANCQWHVPPPRDALKIYKRRDYASDHQSFDWDYSIDGL